MSKKKDKEIKNAPELDEYIEQAQSQTTVIEDDIKECLMRIYEKMSAIAVCGSDKYRNIWFYIQRGDITDFGDYNELLEEGYIDNYASFEEMWLYDYPETHKWYDFAVNEYNGEYYFYIDSKLTFHIAKQLPEYYGKIDTKPLTEYLEKEVTRCVDWLQTDEADYNRYVNNHLTYQRRTGKILRKKFWEISSHNKKTITKGIRKKDVEILKNIVSQSDDDANMKYLQTMTAGMFFDYCKIGYQANNYFKGSDLSSLEMYKAYADGRHEGLTELDLNSEKAFSKWFHDNSRRGGHPWEVCRGGNSTHISLFVYWKINKGWYLHLAGSSVVRVNETVKFAIALYNNNVPFILSDAKEIYNMVCGTDYIGIVPKEFFPRYCHSLFSHDDEPIIDFMNLGWEEADSIIAAAEWYPISIINNRNNVIS